MKSNFAIILLFFLLLLPKTVIGQKAGTDFLVQGKITAATDKLELIGVNVTEIDVNNRVVSGTLTDINGHYVIKIKNAQNKLAFSYLGFVKQVKKIDGEKVINVVMSDNTHEISNVVVTAKKKNTQGGFSVPTREIATAMQSIDTKEFEGLQVSSVDEALQGRIAGLDIV